MIDKTDAVGLVHEHCRQDALCFPFRSVGQPFPAVQTFLELPQPVRSHLGKSGFVHAEGELHQVFLHRVSEFTAGGIFLIAIPLRAKQLIKIGKSRFVPPDTGQGALFIIHIFTQPLLEQLVGIGVDPMVFHLFQGCSGFDLLLQSQELIIARLQF